ncbi:MAG: MFS transporter [Acidobacteriota bacterium]|nr:MFS transporter [Blastocatellia bacterium]MDW8241151.1 MFS transporter [Acidobacteriota bacterium]
MSDHTAHTLPSEHASPQPLLRWIALIVVSLTMFGNYYIYDAINPLADIFIKQLGFSDSDIGWLNSSYSVAAVLTLLIGGIIIDRIGTRKSIALFAVICLLGALLTAAQGSFPMMVAGRTVLGLGAESLIVAVTTALAKWFKGKELSFAFGVNLTIARLGSVAADNSPNWARSVFYPHGTEAEASWQGPLMLAVGFGVICVLAAIGYWVLEASAQRRYTLGKAGEVDRLDVRQIFRFNTSYWLIVGLCFTFYSAIFPFRTFAVKFFMHTHFGELAEDQARQAAGFFNSLIPLSAMVATPLFGLLVDKVGKRALFMLVGSLLLMPVFWLMMQTTLTLWVPIAMLGIAFSLIPAVLWPSVAYIVDESRLGTGYALMTLIQQIGFFALNLLLGKANDLSGASATNPGGYATGMWILSCLGVMGVLFSYLLRRHETGPQAHGLETIRAT